MAGADVRQGGLDFLRGPQTGCSPGGFGGNIVAMDQQTKLPIVVVTGLLVIHGCAAPYDFRDDDRPPYDQMVTSAVLEEMHANGARIIDVRLREDFDADPVMLPDASYRDPDDISRWAGDMSPLDGPVVVYCVRGKWVSQKAANYLRDRGFEVYSLDGGIEAWKQEGRPTAPEYDQLTPAPRERR